MIKLIVMDLDGTLVPYGATAPTEETRRLLARLRERGKTLVFASGREYASLVSYFPEWRRDAYWIGCDGAYTVHLGTSIYGRRIETEDLVRFFRQDLTKNGVIFHGAKKNYAVGNLSERAEIFAPTPIERLGDVKEKIFMVSAYGGDLRLPPLCGLRIHWQGMSMTQYVNRFANKGTALSDLQTRLAISGFETACIGDAENDVSMMRNARRTFCVGRRSEMLYGACNRHVDTVEEALQELLNE